MGAVVRRRAWVVLLTTLLVVATAYVVAGLRPITYTADSVLVVPSGAGGNGPGQANEALTLAATYAELLPRDRRLVAAVAEATGQDASVVTTRLTSAPVGDTALLRLSYTDPDGATAVLASSTAAQTVLSGLETVAPRSLRLVSLASADGVEISGGVTPATGPVGGLLGLALGLVLAAALERADRRVDRARDLADLAGTAAVDLDRASPADLAGAARALRLAVPDGHRVPVLPLVATAAAVERACEALATALPGLRVGEAAPGDGVALVPTSRERVTEGTTGGAVAVVVHRGARRSAVREELGALGALGLSPVVAVLVDRS